MRSVAEGLIDLSESWITQIPETDIALTPRRDIDATVLKALLGVVREARSIDVHYQSMSRTRPDPIWRRISPHAFGYDGFRWHARAYCRQLVSTIRRGVAPIAPRAAPTRAGSIS